jgi:predicted amidophosphoribosyltransferase
MKQAIWALKYKRAVDLAETFARAMSDTLLEELSEELITEAKIILIPVPLSKKRLRHRGYNQAEELAKQMVELNPEQFTLETNLIKKIKDTLTQVSLRDRAKRLANLKGAFEVADWPLASSKLDFRGLRSPTSSWAGQSSNSILIIIDDVSTTGTTIGEIHRILKDNGFYRVYGLVLAHG